ncbi:ribbon-helix-helix protein, CopG family [Plantibacter sp. RU18]|uniref:ribbon-helix-helix protein, CopG family n=1 Tax=Plantibacter sp. RU18 TaxID=3158143 RepID=UPI003D360D53
MSKDITAAEQARYAELAERMEAGTFGPIPIGPASLGAEAELDELLDQMDDDLIDHRVLTPAMPASSETVDAAEVRAVLGRPSLHGTGVSPKRQVRLPADLNALLDERAALEHRNASEIMREALAAYLQAS